MYKPVHIQVSPHHIMDQRRAQYISGLSECFHPYFAMNFFKRLIKDAKRKVFLILDNLRVHHANLVRDWLKQHQNEIEVDYLPSYSPKMNPDEYLNGDLKQRIRCATPARNLKQLKHTVVGHMRKLQKRPERVKSYFRHRDIVYAA